MGNLPPDQTPSDLGPIGGQALPEGVMMRRGSAWGAAVRCRDGSIVTTSARLPPSIAGWRSVPGIRGIVALAETVVLGVRATLWAARTRGSDEGEFTRTGLITTVVVAVVGVFVIFGIMPAALVKVIGIENALAFSLLEGLIRVAILVGYLVALSRSQQVQRVFAYHGAEHMTIHAFEHRRPLSIEEIRHFDRRHPRCGTAFLIIVALVTIVAHALVGHPSWPVLVASRVLGLPVVAAVSYELIRYAGRHAGSMVGKVIAAPGTWLQSITTCEPSDDMIEVATAALEATLEAEVASEAPTQGTVPTSAQAAS